MSARATADHNLGDRIPTPCARSDSLKLIAAARPGNNRRMSVSKHLGIVIEEYDDRIRTFIPHYAEMLDEAAAIVGPRARTIVDLGIGTGALAARCLARAPQARVIGFDADAEMLRLAERRLGGRVTLIDGDFLRAPLPPADAVVASLALHHIRTRSAK